VILVTHAYLRCHRTSATASPACMTARLVAQGRLHATALRIAFIRYGQGVAGLDACTAKRGARLETRTGYAGHRRRRASCNVRARAADLRANACSEGLGPPNVRYRRVEPRDAYWHAGGSRRFDA